MGHGSGAKASLVGENTTRHPHLNSHHDSCANKTTLSSSRRKGVSYNPYKNLRDAIYVHDDNDQAHDNVQPRHERNQFASDSTNTFDASQEDQNAHDDQDSGHKILIKAERGNKIAAYSIGLNHSAGADTGQCSKNGEQHSKPCPLWTKSVLDEVHSSAYPVAGRSFFTKMDREEHFRKFGHHSNKGSNPHPKKSPWAANSYSCSHTNNVTRTNVSSNSCHQSIPRGYFTMTGFI